MTGWGTVGLAVEVMQGGVGDFIQKPWENARLLEVLRTQVDLGRTRREAQRREAEKESRSQKVVLQLHRKEQEIEEAREIQKGFLPKEIPQIEGYQVAGAWQPALVVGGDYFDVLRFSPEHVGFCIADVAGKGIPAALLMSNLQATVRGIRVRDDRSCRAMHDGESLRLPEHCARPLRYFLLRVAGRADETNDVRQRRAQFADCAASGWFVRCAWVKAAMCWDFFPMAGISRARSCSAPAIA